MIEWEECRKVFGLPGRSASEQAYNRKSSTNMLKMHESNTPKAPSSHCGRFLGVEKVCSYEELAGRELKILKLRNFGNSVALVESAD